MSKASILAISAALTVAGFSGGADAASVSIGIQAVVPVICRVQFSQSLGQADAAGLVDLGAAQEFCNAPRGYRVIAQHAQNLEHAAFVVGGQRIPLSATGETVLTDSMHADARSVHVVLDLGADAAEFHALGVRIEAKA